MRKSVAVSAVLALVLGACGGGGEESATTAPAVVSTTSGTEAPAGETTIADTTTAQPTSTVAPVASGAAGTATASLGGTTWEFAMSGAGSEMCDLDVGDAGVVFAVIMFGTDETGREIALNVSGPVSGSAGHTVQVGSATLEFERWTADPAVYGRLSGIEGMPEGVGATVQIDGNTVSGSGVFYDDKALNDVRPTGGPYEAGVVDGTFSVTCPAK